MLRPVAIAAAVVDSLINITMIIGGTVVTPKKAERFASRERQWNARKRREIQNVSSGLNAIAKVGHVSTRNVSQINYQRSPAFAAESTIPYDRLADG